MSRGLLVSKRLLVLIIGMAVFGFAASAQQVGQQGDPAAPKPQDPPAESKRLFGIIPNYRTSASLQNYQPLTSAEKFKIATQDSFDRGTVVLAALFAGDNQLTNAN